GPQARRGDVVDVRHGLDDGPLARLRHPHERRHDGPLRRRAGLPRRRPDVGHLHALQRDAPRPLPHPRPRPHAARHDALRGARPLQPPRRRLDGEPVGPRELAVALPARPQRGEADPQLLRRHRGLGRHRLRQLRAAAEAVRVLRPRSRHGRRRGGRGGGARARGRGRARGPAAVDRHDARVLARRGGPPLPRDLLGEAPRPMGPRRLRRHRPRRGVVHPRPERRHDQGGRQAARAGRGRGRPQRRPARGRERGRRRAARREGRGGRRIRRAGRGGRGERGAAGGARGPARRGAREGAEAAGRLLRGRAAEDAEREGDASGDPRRPPRPRPRQHHGAGVRGRRRGHPRGALTLRDLTGKADRPSGKSLPSVRSPHPSTPMRTVLLLGLLALSPAALAQWSSDPAANLAVADAAGGQDQPKVAPAPDGGTWISWFDGASGYDVRVQKLDAGGNEVFPHGGLLVADRGFSSTQDYGLSVDAAGNALLTFRDDRAGGTQITAALVTAAGDQPWGPTGVQLTNTSAFVAAPKIAGTSDGGAVVAWTQDESTRLQKLDADGVPQWASDVVLTPATGSYSASDLHAHGADVVLAFVHQTGPFGSPRHLLAQKFDAEGDPLWGAGHVAVFDGGSLQFGNFPTFVPDGAGGGVFSWYNTPGAGLQSYVQHVLPDGSEAFAHNGLAVPTNATRERVSPDVAYDAGTGAIYAFWTELANFQSLRGVYGQKFDAAGDRLWTDEGLAVVPVGSDDITGVRTVVNGPGAFVFWDQVPSFGQDRLYGAAASGDDGGTVD